VSHPLCGSPSSLCGGTASNIMLVQANNVTIHGFTLDGDNPSITSGTVRHGADLDARNGIITNNAIGPYSGLHVYDTCVRNIYLRGIYMFGGAFNFHNNDVTNVDGDGASIAMFNFSGSGVMLSNTVSFANDGLSANHSTGTQFLNNTVTNSSSGIHTDNAGDAGGTADVIEGNSISICATDGYGAWVFVPYIAPIVRNNLITGCTVGLADFGQGAGVTPWFVGNTVNGQNGVNSIGALASTDQLGFGSNNISVLFTCNTITNNEVGYYHDQQAGFTIAADLHYNNIQGNSQFGAYNPTTTNVNAVENYWGSATGPTHASNPGGTGDVVTDHVLFTPFFVQPASCANGTPNPTNTPVNTFTPTHTPTNTFTPTETPTDTETPILTSTPTDTSTPTATYTDTPTATDTATATNTPVATDTPTNTATPTNTPQTLLVGHVTWQGRPAQPHTLQQMPITLTVKMGTLEVNYASQTTDSSGFFTVSLGTNPGGTYNWRAKGPQYMANSGSFSFSSGASDVQVEMGLMKAGDLNNDNVINIQDVSIMRNSFQKQQGDPGYDPRADLTGDNNVNIQDYNLLRGNFGQSGAPPITPFTGGGKDAARPDSCLVG
jgi:hypothetical protein